PSPASTSSTTWEAVGGFEADPTAIFPITVDVSALVSGPPARFRILSTNVGERTFVSNPGSTRVEPGATGPNSFSLPAGGARRRRRPARQPHPAAMAESVG